MNNKKVRSVIAIALAIALIVGFGLQQSGTMLRASEEQPAVQAEQEQTEETTPIEEVVEDVEEEEPAEEAEGDQQADVGETGEVEEAEAEEVREKTVYEFEDKNIKAVATLQKPEAVPDDAEFVVTQLKGEIHDTYMEALNKDANDGKKDAADVYNDKNTILYDMAFMVGDEEYQPEKGSVDIKVEFKNDQLENLGAKSAEDISIIHMPLKASVKEDAKSTLTADADVDDINIEPVKESDSDVTVGKKEVVEITIDSLSTFAVAGINEYTPGTSRTFKDILGEATSIGVVAESVTLAGHLETNIATKELNGNNGPWAGPRNSGYAGASYIGSFTGQNGVLIDGGTGTSGKGTQYVYTTPTAASKFGSNTVIMNPDGTIKEYKRSGFQLDFSMTQNQINAYVDKLINDVKKTSDDMFQEPNAFDYTTLPDKSTIDIRGKGAGTYYINFDIGEFNGTNYQILQNIKLDQNQTIVFNIPDAEVAFPQMKVTITGLFNDKATDAGESEDPIAQRIIYNCPNATHAHSTGATTGTFLVPNSGYGYDNDSVAAGWLVAQKVTKIGGQEWHSVYHDMPDPSTINIGVTKNYDGDWDGKEFQFRIEKKSGSDTPASYTVPETIKATESNKNPSFSSMNFGPYNNSNNHTYVFKVSEIAGSDSKITYDDSVYYVKIVAKTENGRTTKTVKYYTDEDCKKEATQGLVFNNFAKDGDPFIKAQKKFSGITAAQIPANFKITVTSKTDRTKTFDLTKANATISSDGLTWSWKLTGVGLDEYTVTESGEGIQDYEVATTGTGNIKVEAANITYKEEEYGTTCSHTNWPVSETEGAAKGFLFGAAETGNNPAIIITAKELSESQKAAIEKYIKGQYSGNWKLPPLYYSVERNGEAFTTPCGPVTYDKNTEEIIIGDTSQWSHTASLSYDITAAKNPDIEVTNTYTKSTGDLKVSKTVTGTTKKDTFSFKVELSDKTISGEYGDMTFNGGIATFDLQHGQSKTATGLPRGIGYTVTETSSDDKYVTTPSSGIITGSISATLSTAEFTNKYEVTSVSGSKNWNDDNNRDGKRPTSITIRLLADGTEVDNKVVKASDNWSWNFTDLPKYKNGSLIAYTITEDEVTDYSTVITGYNVKNSYTPEKTSIQVSKSWDDANNQDGIRPTSVTIKLLADGEDTGKTIELNSGNNWSGGFTNLDKYKSGKVGQVINYTIEENNVSPYTPTITPKEGGGGFDVKNSYTPEKVSISGSKTWDDDNNRDGVRPSSITIKLLADNEETGDEIVVKPDAQGNWSWSFTDLPKFKPGAEGQLITYTFKEDPVPTDYEIVEPSTLNKLINAIFGDGDIIINKHAPEKTSITVNKVWDDDGDRDGVRPNSVKVKLYKTVSGKTEFVEEHTISKSALDDSWSYTFSDLPKKEGGVDIVYSVEEEAVSDYEDPVIVKDASGYTITNKHTPETVNISGSKTWIDNNNQDGKRPTSITVNLLADGTKVDYQTVTPDAQGDWKWSFTGKPKYKNGGTEIKYTVTEEAVNYYTTEVSGYNITNTRNNGDLKVKKVVDGYTTDKKFSFKVQMLKANGDVDEDFEGTFAGKIGSDNVDITFTKGVSNEFKLGHNEEILIKGLPTQHKYEVVETPKSGFTPNWNGTNTGTITKGGTASATCTNTYGASGKVALGATKNLTGRNFKSGDEFTFTVEAQNGAPDFENKSVTIKPTGGTAANISFGEATYDTVGTYTYKVKETSGNIGGITYDGTEYTVTVEVKDNGDGTLTATPTYAVGKDSKNAIVFNNAYKAKDVETDLGATKKITGRDFQANDSFTFTVTSKDSAPDFANKSVTVNPTSGDEVTVDFGKAKYTAVGTYEYTVKETKGSLGGVDYDETEYTVTVEVTDDLNGNLVATKTYAVDDTSKSSIIFTNDYSAEGTLNLGAKKTLTGRALKANEFSFQLKDNDGNVLQTKTNAANGDVTFDGIDYTLADVGKHTYKVVEVDGGLGGVDYDDTVYTVTVDVSDKGDGTLKIEKEYKTGLTQLLSGASSIEFANTYSASGETTLGATKSITGRDFQNGDSFTFTVEAQNGAPDFANKSVTVNPTSGSTVSVDFGKATYTSKGTYEYKVKETKGSIGGIDYDETEYTVTVSVVDNGDGTLKATNSYKVGTDTKTAIGFANTYDATGKANLSVKKALSTGATPDDGKYEFQLIENGKDKQTKTNKGENVTFDAINYTLADVGTHTYTIHESSTAAKGWTNGADVTVVVNVEDNKDGTLKVTYGTDKAGTFTVPTVTNTYSTKGDTELIASKAITGREFKSGDKFTFTVTPQDGAPAFANPSVTIEPTSGYSATVNFGKANYTKAGEYTYIVKETVPEEGKGIKGLTYDTTEYTVIVKVVDDGEGKLTATQSYKVGEDTKTSVAFTNAYNAKGSTTLGATKNITGRSFKEGDKFTFTVTPENAQTPAFANPSVTIEPASGKSEAINFGKANYTKAGEYKYTITETVPAQGQGIKGVAYDTTTYSLTVTVTDNLDGTLTAVKSITVGEDNKDEIVFTNKYSATGTADLGIKKALSTGDDPVGGDYEFQLQDKDGNVLQTKTNEGEDVTFDTINYTLADVGTHTYTIHESSTAAKGWTNGADVKVTVNVSDKGDGTLKVTYGEGEDAKSTFTAPTVTNTYAATGSASLGINKALSTGAAPESGKYKFQLKEGDTVLQTKANDGAAVTFDAITYNYKDIGEHTYTIHESSTAAKGWTNGADVTVKVKVEDNKDGTLKVTYDGKNTFTIPTVTNTYAATGSVDLAITKELSTGDTPEGNKYEFKLFEVIKGDTGDTESELQTKKNAGADVTFDKITYNYSDIGVHTYKIRETSTAAPGWTNAPEKTVTVTVSDNKDGKLNVVTVYGDGGSGATTATNTYSASGTTTLKASKAITGRTFKKGDTFTFTVTPVGNAPAFTNPTVTVDPATGSSVDVDFGTATFTKDGKYIYTVQETVPADEKDKIAGVTYDTTVYTVTVDVTDDKAGKLTAVNSYSAGGQSVDNVAFTNVYNASGETQLSINKTLSTGGTPEDEKYQFQLKEGTKVLQTKTNDGGSVVFDKITYTQDTLGTHTYTIHESSTAEPGWINGDDQTIIVNVSDNGDGTLKITYGENESSSFNPPTITNTKTKIKVSKTNITGQKELEGAHLQIIDKDGKIFEEWNSGNAKDKDAEGNIVPHEVEGLVVGETYTLRETVAPDGYTIAADTIFTIAADGSVISGGTTVADNHILVKDALTETKISKTDITGDNELEGATLQIIEKRTLLPDKVIETWVSGSDGKDASGKIKPHVVTGLKTGVEYTLRETVAPDGYTIATDTTFKLNPDGTISSESTTPVSNEGVLLVKDDLTKVKISKVDITDEEELEGATLQILDKDNKVVETWVSGSDGKDASGKIKPHVVTGLKTGEEYTLKETIAPDGYTIASNTKFTIETDGTVKVGGTAVEGNHILVKDAPTEVKISKTDITGQQELDGAKLQVIKTDDEGKESVVEEWTSGQNGEKVHTIKGLLTGVEYTLRETVAPDGYAITTDTTFTIGTDGSVTYTGTKNDDGVLLVKDDTTKVKISKVDITSQEELEGAHIQIIKPDGTVFEEWNSGNPMDKDAQGNIKPHEVEGLVAGVEYTLRETVAPHGYKITTDTKFKLNPDGTISSESTTPVSDKGVLLVNDEMTTVSISKMDITNDKELPGAKLKITDTDGNTVKMWDKTNEEWVDAEWTSGAAPKEIVGLTTEKTYKLVETTAPNGYAITSETTFTLKKDGTVDSDKTKTTTPMEDGVLLVNDEMTSVKISKMDITNDKELPGASLKITDTDGNTVKMWDKTKEEWVDAEWTSTKDAQEIVGLTTEKTYKLVETTAPDGYAVTTTTEFTLDKEGKVDKTKTTTPTNDKGVLLVNDEMTTVSISKMDVTNDVELPGAKIKIMKVNEDGSEELAQMWDKTKKEWVDAKWTSTEDAQEVVGLTTGTTYKLVETTAPDGYEIATETTFVLKKNGTVDTDKTTTPMNDDGVLLVNDKMTSVKISKVDITDQKELEGAHLQILTTNDEGKKEVAKMWDKDKKDWVDAEWDSGKTPQEITGLTTGVEYTLRETIAPDGYAITTDTTFTIASDGTVTYTGTTTQDGVLLVEDMPIVDVAVNKVWDDEDDKFGIRPQSVTVKLLADGDDTGKTLVLKEDATDPDKSWTGKFEGLDMYKYDAGTKTWNLIIYTVEEVNVPPGYKVTIPQPDEVQKPGDTKTFEVKNSLDLGKLDITKKLDNFYIGDGDTVKATTFAFKVEGFFGKDDQGEDKKIFETMIGIKFDGKGSNTETLEGLPVGTKIVVTEVYSGKTYEAVTTGSQTTEIKKDEQGKDLAKVEFENKYNDNHEQSGIINRFKKDKDKNDGSYKHESNSPKSSENN